MPYYCCAVTCLSCPHVQKATTQNHFLLPDSPPSCSALPHVMDRPAARRDQQAFVFCPALFANGATSDPLLISSTSPPYPTHSLTPRTLPALLSF